MKRIFRRARATEHVLEQADYLAREANLDTAFRFLDALELAFKKLLEHPRIGPARPMLHPRLADIRSWLVPGFEDHIIFYRTHEEGIEIVDVLHGARDLEQLFDEDS